MRHLEYATQAHKGNRGALPQAVAGLYVAIGSEPCEWCGGPVWPAVTISGAGKVSWRHARYCSASCRYGEILASTPADPRSISKMRRAAVLERDGHQCQTCGATDRLVIDHVIPVSKGGTGAMDNLQALCWGCNARKGAKLL